MPDTKTQRRKATRKVSRAPSPTKEDRLEQLRQALKQLAPDDRKKLLAAL